MRHVVRLPLLASAFLALLLPLFLPVVSGCQDPDPSPETESANVSERPPIADVIARRAETLMRDPSVQLVYESVDEAGEPCIKIGVVAATDSLRDALPRTLEGWPVVVVESGEIRPLQD